MATTTDKEWFFARLRQKGRSLRDLAKFLDMDPAAASRSLSGTRKLRDGEAEKIARFLNTTVEEVLTRAGVNIEGTGRPIRFDAMIGEKGEMRTLAEPHELPPSILARAQAAVSGIQGPLRAAQVRAGKGALSIWDDAVLVFEEPTGVEPSAVGVLSIVTLRDGVQMIGYLTKARKTGEATIKVASGESQEVQIDAASPVLAVVP